MAASCFVFAFAARRVRRRLESSSSLPLQYCGVALAPRDALDHAYFHLNRAPLHGHAEGPATQEKYREDVAGSVHPPGQARCVVNHEDNRLEVWSYKRLSVVHILIEGTILALQLTALQPKFRFRILVGEENALCRMQANKSEGRCIGSRCIAPCSRERVVLEYFRHVLRVYAPSVRLIVFFTFLVCSRLNVYLPMPALNGHSHEGWRGLHGAHCLNAALAVPHVPETQVIRVDHGHDVNNIQEDGHIDEKVNAVDWNIMGHDHSNDAGHGEEVDGEAAPPAAFAQCDRAWPVNEGSIGGRDP